MAVEVLNGLMCRKITVDDLIKWLTADQTVIFERENLMIVYIIWL
jgi:hypothetical protein